MRPILPALLAFACDEPIKELSGPLADEDVCALSQMSWAATWDHTESPTQPVEYDDLTLHLEPTAAGTGALDLALCLSGSVTWRFGGASGTSTLAASAETGTMEKLTGLGYLVADDGTLPCVGITAGLSGDLAERVAFTEESYWWEGGTDRAYAGGEAWGEIHDAGAWASLDLPTDLADGLGLSGTVALAGGAPSRWDDPLCAPVE